MSAGGDRAARSEGRSFWPGPLTVWAGLAAGSSSVVGLAVACWLVGSLVPWLIALVGLVIVLVLAVGYNRPSRWLLRGPHRFLVVLCGLGGAASVARVEDLRRDQVPTLTMGTFAVLLVVLTFVVWGLREPRGAVVSRPLRFPLDRRRCAVAAGGVVAFNGHANRRADTGAIDLVAVGRDGRRASGVCPAELGDYETFDCNVLSPCAGLVVEAVDSFPDEVPWRSSVPPRGANHVRIDTGTELICLAHLRQGSLRVSVGERVLAGEPIARVGNSGTRTEPHLHVHAESNGRGLRLRFDDAAHGRLRPGMVIDRRAPSARRRRWLRES
jgi:hypothetical protein